MTIIFFIYNCVHILRLGNSDLTALRVIKITLKDEKRAKYLLIFNTATVQHSTQKCGRDGEAYPESSQTSNMEVLWKINKT